MSLHLIRKHGFQLPSGHRRFTYSQDLDGFFRVQTMRMESLEVSEQIMAPSATESTKADVQFELTQLMKGERGFSISMMTKGATTATTAIESSSNAQTVIEEKPLIEGADEYREMPVLSKDESFSDDDQRCEDELVDDNDEVDIDEEVMDDTYYTRSTARANNDAIAIRSIDDFSVMRKYLKHKRPNRKRIMITVEELDAAGNVVSTETQQAAEFEL